MQNHLSDVAFLLDSPIPWRRCGANVWEPSLEYRFPQSTAGRIRHRSSALFRSALPQTVADHVETDRCTKPPPLQLRTPEATQTFACPSLVHCDDKNSRDRG